MTPFPLSRRVALAVTAQAVGDQPTAMRIAAGRDGFKPPY